MQSSANTENTAKLVWQWGGHWYSLPVSPRDMLVLARAVEEEGFPQAGVAWALLQRAAWLRTQGQNVSLAKLVEQYAQPINPAWFATGEKHRAEIARLERLGDTRGVAQERARADVRPLKASRPWSSLSPETHAVIAGVLSNSIKSPVTGAVHYWASRGPDFATNQQAKPGLILLDRGYGFGPGRNVFFAVAGSEKFGGLRFQQGSLADPSGGGLNIASFDPGALLLCGAIGYALWKWLS